MVFLRSRVTAALATFSLLQRPVASSLISKLKSLTPGARDILKRSVPAPPRFIVYSDAWVNPLPTPAEIEGFNVYALSFWTTSGATDMALGWERLTDSQRTSYLEEYNNSGISLIVSAFGAIEQPTTAGTDPVAVANSLASWVLQFGLQGVDIDYEDYLAFDGNGGTAEPWLINLTRQLRTQLPQQKYSLSHAPVAPWFTPNIWSGGGYLEVNAVVGSLINFYHIQFYNQGATEYATCNGLLTASSSSWPETAVFQIANNGVDINKLVIGKPSTPTDTKNGYMSPSTLASCVSEAHSAGWSGGIMVWEYPDAGSEWITTARGNTWPVSGSSSSSAIAASTTSATKPTTTRTSAVATTTATTSTAVSTTTATSTATATMTASSGTGSCAGVSAWVNNISYNNGSEVTYNNHLWVANQWNQNEAPGAPSAAWTDHGACT